MIFRNEWQFVTLGRLALVLTLLSATDIATHAETLDGSRIFVLDGDTVALPCSVPARGCAEKIRLRAIDAPETSNAHCEAELQAGLAAKQRLAELLRAGPVSVQRSGEIDRYGRSLGDLETSAGDAGAVLVRERLALPYQPGSGAKASRIAHWCR